MIGVDANILVRFLVGDDTKQADKVYRIFKKVEGEKNQLFVSFNMLFLRRKNQNLIFQIY